MEEYRKGQIRGFKIAVVTLAAITIAPSIPTVIEAFLLWASRNPDKAQQLANDAVQASSGNPTSMPEARSVNLGRKLEYILGNATGSAHNIQRSTSMAVELSRIGLRDTAETRTLLTEHLTQVARMPGVAQANGNVVRESFLMGPGGAVKLKTIWEETKDRINLITVEVLKAK
jgi:hypothetical protein